MLLSSAIHRFARAGYCLRIVALLALLFANLSPALGAGHAVAAPSAAPPAQAAPAVAATKTDRLLVDRDGDGRADPGDTLRYTVVVSNTGATNATGVTFNDTLDRNVTLTPGSIQTTPLALGQAATTNEDTALPLTLGASDADGDVLTFTILSAPTHGTLSGVSALST